MDNYRHNPYVRSTVNIILLQTLLAMLIVGAFGLALKFQQDNTVAVISQSLQTAIEGNATTSPPLAESLESVKDTTFQYVLLGIVLLTALFGYATARFALRPTRNSLESQKRFIGNMAHEIRTPLAIIKTNTEVALMDPALTPSMRDILTTSNEEVDRISEIIHTLLSLNTMLRPGTIPRAEIDLTEIARTVVERHEALAATRGISLTLSGDTPHKIFGNSTGIEQIFTNLIKNALNYTPRHAGGSVTVRVTANRDTAIVSVSDTGIGIAKKDIFHIFQPFYRADTSRARGVGGGTSGLGLAIVNEIVKTHHGKILVRSALNRGTTIEVTFPKTESDGIYDTEGGAADEEEYEVNIGPT